ncbi:hypothetical protein [Agromyces laixinhei]|uniref:hypothetical protein n=1 Tax=Agromyces laixinhei TaxID=2585717 RepID=UPI0012EDD742|nr:hypothetical protein [Agromyces laixinhei]
MPVRTSRFLLPGHVYTRADLKDAFGIIDASINNGIFQPKGHDSVWLFVTKEKTADRVQYADRLDGAILTFPGQTEGRTDSKLFDHVANGHELIVFYRDRKYEHPGAGFQFEGGFEYVTHVPGRPSVFTLRRVDGA